VVLFILWCVNEKKGLRLGIVLILSVWINGAVKDLFRQPRPYELDPSVGRALESGYGLPSGHAQISLVFLILLAVWMGNRTGRRGRYALRAAAVLMILLTGFTRLYLGVHFPTDVLAGWLLGGLVLGLYALLGRHIEAALNAGGSRACMISCAGAALLMNALRPGRVYLGALFLGFGLGYALMRGRFPFSARAGTDNKPPLAAFGPRCIAGALGTALIYLGLKAPAYASLPGDYYAIARFIQYGLWGFWPTAAAPWLFLRLRIASGP
jgi:hypothetical protein